MNAIGTNSVALCGEPAAPRTGWLAYICTRCCPLEGTNVENRAGAYTLIQISTFDLGVHVGRMGQSRRRGSGGHGY